MAEKIQIIVAEHAGFCPGVKNAIDKVIELSEKRKRKIYTLGPLIHNKQVIATLEEKNIFAVEDYREINEERAILVIRAHGITPELEEKVRNGGLEVVDSTCPLVKKVHSNIKCWSEKGYHTVIAGDKNHAEVIGLMGYAGRNCSVVADPEEARRLPPMEKVNLVAQTTQEMDNFTEIADVLKEKAGELVVSDTICKPTKDRQRETVKYAAESDLVIVVGGKHSANTQRLYKICSRLSSRAVLVETDAEIPGNLTEGVRKVFITAGASTPNWMIEKVVRKIRKSADYSHGLAGRLMFLWNITVTSGIFTAAAAMLLSWICVRMEGVEPDMRFAVLAGLFVGSLHLFNRIEEKGAKIPDEVQNWLFVENRKTMRYIAAAAGAASMMLSFSFGSVIFFLTALFWLLGTLYPRKTGKFGKMTDFPASKDIATSFGWAFVCAAVPAISAGILQEKTAHFAVFMAVTGVFMRSTLIGVSNAENDMIIGKENLYKAAGRGLTFLILFFALFILEAALWTAARRGYMSGEMRIIALSFIYYGLLFALFLARRIPKRVVAETAIDAQFFLTFFLLWL